MVVTFEDALKIGGWEPEDMAKIPFTLLIKDCPASFLTHTRGVTRICKVSMDEYNVLYKDEGASSWIMTCSSLPPCFTMWASWWNTSAT